MGSFDSAFLKYVSLPMLFSLVDFLIRNLGLVSELHSGHSHLDSLGFAIVRIELKCSILIFCDINIVLIRK